MNKHFSWIRFSFFLSIGLVLLVYLGSSAVTVINEQSSIKRTHTIIIDAGHGGEDGGASSPHGVPESSYNLSIAWKLEHLLRLLGQNTRMVRSEDISVYTEGETLSEKKRSDLKERVRIVNDTANGVLLSIHQNNYPDRKYHGAQVFYADTAGSKELAETLQGVLANSLNPNNKRKIKKASGIYLMEHIQRPGVLIECGFLSNPQEEALLGNEDYQKKIACAIAVSVIAFLEKDEAPNA